MAHKVVVNKDAVLEHQGRKIHVLPINGTTCISLFCKQFLRVNHANKKILEI